MTFNQKKLIKLMKQVQPLEAHPLMFDLMEVKGKTQPAFKAVNPETGSPPEASPFDREKTVDILKELKDLGLILPSTNLDAKNSQYMILRHPAYHTGELFLRRIGEFLFKSVFVPVIVALLTTLVTLWLKRIFG